MRHWGHDITDEDTPIEAGLGFAIDWEKGEFLGRDALLAQKDAPRSKRLIQFRIEDPDLLTYHDEPIYRDGVVVGSTSSSMWSATQNRCCAMGYVEHPDGESITAPGSTRRLGGQHRWPDGSVVDIDPFLVRPTESAPPSRRVGMQVLGVERSRLRIVRSAPGSARGSGTVGVVHPSLRLPLSAIGLIAGFVAAACTSVPPEELSVPLPTTTVESESAPVAEMESESTAGSDVSPDTPAVAGELAIGGLEGMVVADASGAVVRSAFPNGVATQPTWSRAGDRAISFVPSATGGSVVVSAGDDALAVGARRPYFFFSWSGDGAYVAALGPGPRGTSLDILTPEGELATDATIDTGSFYLAWEPGGDDLVVHLDDELFLLRDPRDLETRESLGAPGQSFLAPVWIPETRHIVIVDDVDGSDEGRLIRLDVDDRSEQDLDRSGVVSG